MKPEFESFWTRAALGTALVVVLMSGLHLALGETEFGNPGEFVLGVTFALLLALVVAPAVFLLARAARALPGPALLVFTASLLTLWLLQSYSGAQQLRFAFDRQSWSWPNLGGPYSVWTLSLLALTLGLAAALFSVYRRVGLEEVTRGVWQRVAVLSAALAVLSLLVILRLAGDGHDPFAEDGAILQDAGLTGSLADPAAPGPYAVATLSYGAGQNPRRPEFGEARQLESRTVDATRLLPEWKGFRQARRESYWGFGLEHAPLNGLVWAPEGPGPFPLVLIVHGNHGMEDYSDAGYAYLGERLASQGFIVVSVDQNYINGSWSGDFRGKEMAARGWLLLEHLALWRDWNEREGHPFAAQVDMNNIALIGHSRGGEAIAIAQRFNSLPHFPDDARVRFDYGFSIRSLVAIAQVDQRYQRRMHLEDVNFLTLHGSYDSDEPAYHGLRQMNRIRFTEKDYFLKSGVYLHGANHGQFNTGWGRYDYSPPGSWLLNTAPMIAGEDQRRVARVYISAFLRATLQGETAYRALLKDPRVGAPWLPAATYVHQFADSTFTALADFDEDLDVTTGSREGVTLRAEGLDLWREEALMHRDKRTQGSNALILGWRQPQARLVLSMADSPPLSAAHSLVFAVSGSLEKLPPAPDQDGSAAEPSAPGDEEPPVITDFSVELVDRRGTMLRVLASDYAQLVPPVRVQYLKDAAANREAYNAVWEPVLQHVELPLQALAAAEPALRLEDLREIRLVFDQAGEGILIFDEIGFATRDPGL